MVTTFKGTVTRTSGLGVDRPCRSPKKASPCEWAGRLHLVVADHAFLSLVA